MWLHMISAWLPYSACWEQGRNNCPSEDWIWRHLLPLFFLSAFWTVSGCGKRRLRRFPLCFGEIIAVLQVCKKRVTARHPTKNTQNKCLPHPCTFLSAWPMIAHLFHDVGGELRGLHIFAVVPQYCSGCSLFLDCACVCGGDSQVVLVGLSPILLGGWHLCGRGLRNSLYYDRPKKKLPLFFKIV